MVREKFDRHTVPRPLNFVKRKHETYYCGFLVKRESASDGKRSRNKYTSTLLIPMYLVNDCCIIIVNVQPPYFNCQSRSNCG